MCPGENFSFGSPNNYGNKFFHETQIKKSQKVDRQKWSLRSFY